MSAFETLFPELSLEDFKNNYWPDKQPCLYHGEVGRLATILNISQKNNLKNILVEKPKNMFAWWKTDKVNLVPINASIAFDLYQLGIFTLQLRKAEQDFSDIDELMKNLSDQFETLLNYRFCAMYCSPKGAATANHFDPQEIIIIQLAGTKRWTIYENDFVKFPTQGYWGGTVNPLLASQLASELERPQKPLFSVEMQPGSVLFLPRGYWHETETLEDSIALTLSFNVMNSVDYLCKIFFQNLVDDETWRVPTPFASNGYISIQFLEELRHRALTLLKDDKNLTHLLQKNLKKQNYLFESETHWSEH